MDGIFIATKQTFTLASIEIAMRKSAACEDVFACASACNSTRSGNRKLHVNWIVASGAVLLLPAHKMNQFTKICNGKIQFSQNNKFFRAWKVFVFYRQSTVMATAACVCVCTLMCEFTGFTIFLFLFFALATCKAVNFQAQI